MTTITNVGADATTAIEPSTSVTKTSGTPPASGESLLPAPTISLGSASITALAMIMVKEDEQEQTSQTKIQDAANVAASQDDAARVQSMRDKAGADLGAAWSSGLGDIAGGALSIAGAGFEDKPNVVDAHDVLAGLSKAAPGVGTIVAGGYKSAGDLDDANAAQSEAASGADLRRYQDAQSQAQSASDSVAQVEQYLQAILQTEQQTREAAVTKG